MDPLSPIVELWRLLFNRLAIKWIAKFTGGIVNDGPFKGLSYPPPFNNGNAIPAKLLGLYEKELHPVISQMAAQKFSYLVNIGASEGYYACGFARLWPASTVFAYEADQLARENLTSLVTHNRLNQQIAIRHFCTRESLRELAASLDAFQTLILCDIEGGELDLLDPSEAPWLAHATILFESHDFARPNASTIIIERFASTHQVQRIPCLPRSAADLPVSLPSFLQRRLMFLVSDQRLHTDLQDFVLLTPANH